MVRRVMRGTGGTVTQTPLDPAIVKHQSVVTLTDLTPGAADPGDTILNEADGRVYRMKTGTTDASNPDNWEVDDYVLPRQYASESARGNRTGFTPKVGEIIGINGTRDYYQAGDTAAADARINEDSQAEITRSNERPTINNGAGLIHFRTFTDGTDPVRWDYSGDNRWINTGFAAVNFEPTGTDALEITAFMASSTFSIQWFDGDGGLLTESDFYSQPASNANNLQMYAVTAASVVGLEVRGCKTFPPEIADLSELETLDFRGSGLEGNCPYLGTLGNLTTLVIADNPGFTMDPSCIVDNVGLTVVSV